MAVRLYLMALASAAVQELRNEASPALLRPIQSTRLRRRFRISRAGVILPLAAVRAAAKARALQGPRIGSRPRSRQLRMLRRPAVPRRLWWKAIPMAALPAALPATPAVVQRTLIPRPTTKTPAEEAQGMVGRGAWVGSAGIAQVSWADMAAHLSR